MKPVKSAMCRNPRQLRDARVEEAVCLLLEGSVKPHFLSPQSVCDTSAVGKVWKVWRNKKLLTYSHMCVCVSGGGGGGYWLVTPAKFLSIFFDLSEAKRKKNNSFVGLCDSSLCWDLNVCHYLFATETNSQCCLWIPGDQFSPAADTLYRWNEPSGICPFSKVMRLSVLPFTDLWLFILFLVQDLPLAGSHLPLLLTPTQPQPESHPYRNWTWLNCNLALGLSALQDAISPTKTILLSGCCCKGSSAAGWPSTHQTQSNPI